MRDDLGLHRRRSHPIEVGYALPNGQAYCTLIRPAPRWTHWEAGAEALHGIARTAALQHGHRIDDVARHLNEKLRVALAKQAAAQLETALREVFSNARHQGGRFGDPVLKQKGRP